MKAIADSFRGLMAAVISRALADLKKNSRAIKASDHVRDEVMAWINSPECEAFCLALDTDYRAIRGQAAVYISLVRGTKPEVSPRWLEVFRP